MGVDPVLGSFYCLRDSWMPLFAAGCDGVMDFVLGSVVEWLCECCLEVGV